MHACVCGGAHACIKIFVHSLDTMESSSDRPINIDTYLWSLVDAVCANMPYEALLETQYVKHIQECLQKFPHHPFSVSCTQFVPWDVVSAVFQYDDNDMNVYYDDVNDNIIFESFDDMFNGLLHVAKMTLKNEECYSDALDHVHILKMRKYCAFMESVSSILDINEMSEMMDSFCIKS